MADETLPNQRQRQQFPEVRGKIVDNVELSADYDYYGIIIRFNDKTALTFRIESSVVTFPAFLDWANGEEKPLKRYEPIRSKAFRLE
jgi:hypothetical protein